MPADKVTDPVESLVLDLLEWLGTAARPYDEVMDAWRTSCPRLPVWETANELGLVQRSRTGDSRPGVAVTDAGRRYLALRRTPVAS
jgi:D-3-phosphoglycerate dehydrogenase